LASNGDSTDALDLLLDESRRNSLDAQHIAHMVEAVAGSLHDVYVVAAVLAMVTLATALLLPAGSSPAHPAAAS
jgi:hypothetical protein